MRYVLIIAVAALSGCTTIQCNKGLDKWGRADKSTSGCSVTVNMLGMPSAAQAEAIKKTLEAAQ